MGGGGLVHCGQLIFSKVQEARADSMKLAVNDWCWFPSITVTGVCVCGGRQLSGSLQFVQFHHC